MREPHNDKVCKYCGAHGKWGILPICSYCVWEHILGAIHGIVSLLGIGGVMLFPFSLYSLGFWLVNGTWPDPISFKSLLGPSNFSFLVDLQSVSGFAQLWMWLVTQSFASLSAYLILGFVISSRAFTLLQELEITKGTPPWFIPRNPFTGLAVTSHRDLSSDQNYPPKGFRITVIVSVQFTNRSEEKFGSGERSVAYKITKPPHTVQFYKVIEHFPYVPPKGSLIDIFMSTHLGHPSMEVTSSTMEVLSVKSPSDQIDAAILIEPTKQHGKIYSVHDDINYLDDLLDHLLHHGSYKIDDPFAVLEVFQELAAADPDEYHRQRLEKIWERAKPKLFPDRYKID